MVFISKIHNNVNLLNVYMPFDLGENVHKWMKVNFVILVLVQIVGSENNFTQWLIFIGSVGLCRQAIKELEWTPA